METIHLLAPFVFVHRKFMKLINQNYVKNKLKKRKGKCKKCGTCCFNCEFLDRKNHLCRTYKNRPWFCYREFPLDKLDQKVLGVVRNCGYNFSSFESFK